MNFSKAAVRMLRRRRSRSHEGAIMNRIKRGVLLFAILVMMRALASAHEGHDHKIMGTIAAIEQTKIDVKTRDGKTVTIVLAAATKILRGTAAAAVGDLKVGERVVVNVGAGKEPLTAKDVRVAVAKVQKTTDSGTSGQGSAIRAGGSGRPESDTRAAAL